MKRIFESTMAMFFVAFIFFGLMYFTDTQISVTVDCNCESEQWIQSEIDFIIKTNEPNSISHDRLGYLLDQINCRRKCV